MPRECVVRFALAVALVTMSPIAAALGGTIHVPGDQPTIQQGIDAAQPGQVVEIDAGTYTGVLNRNLDFHGKAIVVRGAGPSTVVDAEYLGRGFIFQSGEGAASVLEELTITRGLIPPVPGSHGGGILFTGGSSPTVRNCVISSCGAERGGGMEIDGSSPAITNCFILNNRPFPFDPGNGSGAGILCTNGAAPVISGSTFQRNSICRHRCANIARSQPAAGAAHPREYDRSFRRWRFHRMRSGNGHRHLLRHLRQFRRRLGVMHRCAAGPGRELLS